MENFVVEVQVTYKFPIKYENENALWEIDEFQLRSLAYKYLPTPSSNNILLDVKILDIERGNTGGTTIPFPLD